MRTLLIKSLPLLDIALLPFVFVGGIVLLIVRRAGLHRMPASKRVLRFIGLLPVRRHYHEPFVSPSDLRFPLTDSRSLPGVDLNDEEQLSTLREFTYTEELRAIPTAKPKDIHYYYDNGVYGPGDAEFLYSIIRSRRPHRIVEVGCGNSSLMAELAIGRNRTEDPSYNCLHVCIEPFEAPWLEDTGVSVVRQKIQDVDITYFTSLQSNDILFIDSSHVIRPQGDVLAEFLNILPRLNSGVLVHIHDVFTPRDYPEDWVLGETRLWNEQYLLEAFLTNNSSFRIVGALNYLKHNFTEAISRCFPILAERPHAEPGAFWIVRN